MTDNGKAIQLKLQKAKENAAGHEATRKVFLGNFIYAEFVKGGYIRLTDEDGCGRPVDTILLSAENLMALMGAIRQ